MPWSEWQDPEELLHTPGRVSLQWVSPETGVVWTDADGNVHTIYGPHSEPSPWPTNSETNGAQTFSGGSASTYPTMGGYNYWLREGWQQQRAQPSVLAGMIEGVDYGVIPGKDPAVDDDAYVQFETGVNNTILGWDLGTFTVLTVGYQTPDGSPASGSTARVSMSTVYYPQEPWVQLGDAPGISSTMFEYAVEDASDGLQFDAPDPGSVTAVAYYATVSAPIAVPGSTASTEYVMEPVQARLLQPRWRYWIPGAPLPLRQKQRNDAIVRGVRRARSTSSMQNSVRQNSYR